MDKWINPANSYASYGPGENLQTLTERVNRGYEEQRKRYIAEYIEGATEGRKWPSEDKYRAKVDKKRKSVYN